MNHWPTPIDSKRVYIRFAEDGGTENDGVIELRRGVEDISLGDAKYARVRINVDNKLYIKGLAIFSDNVPYGFDVVYNTCRSKSRYSNPLDALDKLIVYDENAPFDKSIKEGCQYGVINIVTDSVDLKELRSPEYSRSKDRSVRVTNELIDAINAAIEQSVWHGGEEDWCYFSFLKDQAMSVTMVASLLGVGIEPEMSANGEKVLWYKLSYK